MICILIKEYETEEHFNSYLKQDYQFLLDRPMIILDIETTGFSRQYDQIIIIGLIIYNHERSKTLQLFAKNTAEEFEILKKLKEIFINHNRPMVYTYNGFSFDIPFINARFKTHGIDFKINKYNNFDIYRLIRSNKNKFNLKSYKLKSVEKFLKIDRSDTISGKESVELFKQLKQSNDPKLLNKILLHNLEDIQLLIPISEILNYLTLNEIYEYYPAPIHQQFYIHNIKLTKKYLECKLSNPNHINIEYYSDFYKVLSTKNRITIELLVKNFNDHLTLIYPSVLFDESYDQLSIEQRHQLIIRNETVQFKNIHEILTKIIQYLDEINIISKI